jgi:hypothetical protein
MSDAPRVLQDDNAAVGNAVPVSYRLLQHVNRTKSGRIVLPGEYPYPPEPARGRYAQAAPFGGVLPALSPARLEKKTDGIAFATPPKGVMKPTAEVYAVRVRSGVASIQEPPAGTSLRRTLMSPFPCLRRLPFSWRPLSFPFVDCAGGARGKRRTARLGKGRRNFLDGNGGFGVRPRTRRYVNEHCPTQTGRKGASGFSIARFLSKLRRPS